MRRFDGRQALLAAIVASIVFYIPPIAMQVLAPPAQTVTVHSFDQSIRVAPGVPPPPKFHWEGDLADTPWGMNAVARPEFSWQLRQTHSSGYAQLVMDIDILIQGEQYQDRRHTADSFQGMITAEHRRDEFVRIDPQKPQTLALSVAFDLENEEPGDWTFLWTPLWVKQVSHAADTDLDGLPQSVQLLTFLPTYIPVAVAGVTGGIGFRRILGIAATE